MKDQRYAYAIHFLAGRRKFRKVSLRTVQGGRERYEISMSRCFIVVSIYIICGRQKPFRTRGTCTCAFIKKRAYLLGL